MNRTLLYSAALCGLALLASACQSDKAKLKLMPTGLTGYWQLSRQECMCPPNTPTPNEALEFDGTGQVREYTNGQLAHSSSYQLGTGSTSCASNTNVVTIHYASNPITAAYTIANDTLVLDQGLCADAPRKTYKYVGPKRQK